ncbi:hypothetical protein BN971_03686 [Mycobacterium bohemicum DSM 44277]|uniref:DUF732 domain-containing protein n=2 Tax=Mycobacterium bohemicum TaxID=56425 RepID=A0A1X1R3D9_MYCBE|nr:DUF732 domain-containing protein [Mycobacterium bohemicum]MCV6970308.1 DUF732 domain-containing protein [Mycobacterium bohemicum]ORU98734.1 hypothetical protein AWB93_12860 [Mycobacterium bohemicum]CPR12388.1 hypothetical protein BN971_03686 [Mycobacterium bohemicum DSM 44277]
MTDDDNADEQPPTIAAEHDETAFMPPSGQPGPSLAWSLDHDADTVLLGRRAWDSRWARAVLGAGCAAAVALLAAVGGLIAMLAHRGDRSPAPAAQPATVVVQTSIVAPAPPVTATVTVQAAPTTVTVKVPVTPTRALKAVTPSSVDNANDERFLARMRSLGYTVTDKDLILRNAHETCRLFQSGESVEQVNQQMSTQMRASMSDTVQLTSSAILAYPDCFRPAPPALGDGD